MEDLSGRTYNSWTTIAFSHKAPINKLHWLCRCKCGKERVIDSYNLRAGRTKSCRRCSAAIVGATVHKKHGLSKSKVYRAWQSMKTRCYNKNAERCYKYHGAREIKVWDGWINDFEAFYAHIGEPPTPNHTVDRMKNDGHYEPGNVRWATQAEQMSNRRQWVKKNTKRRLSPFQDPQD